MNKYFQWLILTGLTGSPIGSLLILAAVWWMMDRYTLQVLPNPLQGLMRWQRGTRLRATLADNPSDRRARFELADILLQQKRAKAAFEVLRPNYEAGDHDPGTLFLLGLAAKGSGQLDQAERLLQAAYEDDPDYRLGAPGLELAEVLLKKERHADAVKVLEGFITKRRSTVRGRVLLAQARSKLGDAPGAARAKEEAWQEYVGMPRYQRRSERLWAWRAKPSRPAIYAVLALAGAILFSQVIAPALSGDASMMAPPD